VLRKERGEPRATSGGRIAAAAGVDDAMWIVLGIEPLVYETGFGFGMQNKDMLLVTGNGCELLSDYANTDKLLIVA